MSMQLRKRPLVEQHDTRKRTKRRLTMINTIEDFSGEVWFELFAFFDAQSLVHSFSGLNFRINSLLRDRRLPIHLNIASPDSLILPTPFDSHQIISLRLCTNVGIKQMIDLSPFVRLRSLRLMFIDNNRLEQIGQLPLNHLYQVSIKSKYVRMITPIITSYFPRVNRMILDPMEREFLVKRPLNGAMKSQIRKLTLNGTIKLASLFRLWPLVPELRCLSLENGGVHQCDYWVDEDIISSRAFPPHLSSLHIRITDDDLSFSNVERLIPCSLRHLTISGSMADDDFDDYIKSSNWIQLMSRATTTLVRITLDLESYFDPGDLPGLHMTLMYYRQNPFFRNTIISSKQFLVTIKGYIEPDVQHE